MKRTHPPSYSDIVHTNKILSNNFSDCEYSDVGSNIEFSLSDQCHIFDQRNPTYILASAIISDSHWLWWRNTSAIKVDKLSFQERKLYYQHLIIHDLFQHSDANADKYNQIYYENISDQLIEIDSENSYPYYLKAILLYSFSNRVDEVLEQIDIGNQKNTYDDYSILKYQIIRDTALFLGYSPFAARYYANMKTEFDFFILAPRLLKICKKIQKEEDCKTCIKTGQIIENKGLFVAERMYGQWIQAKTPGNLDSGLKYRQKILKDKDKLILELKISNQIEEHKFIQLIEDIMGSSPFLTSI